MHGLCVCTIWTDVRPLFFPIMFITRQEATGSLHGCRQRSSMQLTRIRSLTNCTYMRTILFYRTWRAAKPRTAQLKLCYIHGCRNLKISLASFPTLFAWYFYSHGEGLSREPYSDYFLFQGLCLWLVCRFQNTFNFFSQFSSKRSTSGHCF